MSSTRRTWGNVRMLFMMSLAIVGQCGCVSMRSGPVGKLIYVDTETITDPSMYVQVNAELTEKGFDVSAGIVNGLSEDVLLVTGPQEVIQLTKVRYEQQGEAKVVFPEVRSPGSIQEKYIRLQPMCPGTSIKHALPQNVYRARRLVDCLEDAVASDSFNVTIKVNVAYYVMGEERRREISLERKVRLVRE